MSSFWSIWIIAIVLFNILGLVFLLQWTSKRRGTDAAAAEGETTGHVWDDDLSEYNNPLPKWWLYLFYITIVFAFGYLALYPGFGRFEGLLGWTQEKAYDQEVAAVEEKYSELYASMAAQPIPVLAADDQAMETGRRLFGNNCAVCHGADGGGAPGFPNLRDDDWLYGGTPEAIKTSILNGRQGVMPGWASALGNKGVDEVAAYVYSLNGREVPANMLGDGEAKFMAMCASCHGADGTGNQMLGAPDLTDNVWLYGGSLAAIRESIANGRSGKMPAHASLLGEDRVHIVAAYVYSLSQRANDGAESQ